MNENESSTAITSVSALGQAFCRVTVMPGRTGSTQARTFGTPSTATRQLGHAPAMQESPRGRWYLKERENVVMPAAAAAATIMSPSTATLLRPATLDVLRP